MGVHMVAFKCKLAIPKFLVFRKLTSMILNILNRVLLFYFLFNETLITADPRNILLYLLIFWPKLLITVFFYTGSPSCLYTQWISCNFLLRSQSELTHILLWSAHLCILRRGCCVINTRKLSLLPEQIKVPLKRNFAPM